MHGLFAAEYMNAFFSPGKNAAFGDPELTNLFLGGILGGPGRAYAGETFWAEFFGHPADLFSPDSFPPGENAFTCA